MLKIIALTAFLFLLGIGGTFAWKLGKVRFADDYDSLLKSLYKYTVPLKHATEIAKAPKNYVFVDTRAKEEYAVSHIEDALWLNYDKPDMKLFERYPKNTAFVLYCSVGYRSERIGEKLLKMGYSNVNNLYGGLFQWFNDAHPVVGKANTPTNKIHGYSKSWGKWITRGETVYE
jgi:rhodanese-related sulfurtransferase